MDIEYVATPPPQQLGYARPPAAQPAPSGGARRFGLVVGLVAVLVVGGAIGLFSALMGPTVIDGSATAPPVEYRELTIELDLYDTSSYNYSTCAGGDGGYSDINPGMPFTVRDQTGEVVASTFLPSTGRAHAGGHGCTWSMTVDVPAHIRHVVITGGSRGEITYSRDDLAANDWVAPLSIGD
ncbi:hypothetical protein [Blastococcus sp. SYSU D00695]